MDKPSCQNCRFWVSGYLVVDPGGRRYLHRTDYHMGECRRRCPGPEWPFTQKSDGCGEWQQGEERE